MTPGCIVHRTDRAPASAVEVVSSTFGGIRQDLIGSYNKSIPLESYIVRQSVSKRLYMSVGMVDFNEFVEAGFAIWSRLLLVKDLIRCWIGTRWPF